MKFVALGSNLPVAHVSLIENLRAAVAALAAQKFNIIARALLYTSAPVPASDQPDFINTVVQVAFDGTPEEALARCMAIETAMGRVRQQRNEARIIDIDIIAWDDMVQAGSPELPHPRLHERAFVVWPLCDIAPDWMHPLLCRTVQDLKHALLPSDIRLSAEQW